MKLRSFSYALALVAGLTINMGFAAQTQTRASGFEYFDASSPWAGMLKAEIIEPNNPDVCVRTEYEYDNNNPNAIHGNKTKTTVKPCANVSAAATFAQRSSSVAFDTNGQFATSSTNALNQSESYSVIEPRFGLAKKQTGPNSLSSTVTLDELGRKTKTTAPDTSRIETTTYSCKNAVDAGYNSGDPMADLVNTAYCGYGTFTNPSTGLAQTVASYSQTLRYAANGVQQGGVQFAFFDDLGREIASVSTGIDIPGTAAFYQRTLKAYDRNSRQAYTSTVHKLDTAGNLMSGSQIRWSVVVFDAYGRPYRTYTPDDSGVDTTGMVNSSDSNVALSPLIGKAKIGEVVYADGKTTTRQYTAPNAYTLMGIETKNAAGQLMLKEDAYGNQIAYIYDVQGQLKGTKDGANNSTSLSFDIRGRKTTQVDPDLGTWTYSYNALGELKSQADAKGQTQSMSYDLLGRLVQKFTVEFTTNYVYDCNRAATLGDGSTYLGIGSLCEENTTQGYLKHSNSR
jgi:YD repeat-containing protein